MTMTFKTFEKVSNHENVKRHLSSNYITCGCYGIYACDEESKWMSGDIMYTADTDSVYIDIEVCDDLLDWVVGCKTEPFCKKYTSHDMLGNSDHICRAVERFSGAVTITEELDCESKNDNCLHEFLLENSSSKSSLTIYPDDLVDALLAGKDMLHGDQAYSEAWLSMPLNFRQKYWKDKDSLDLDEWNRVGNS